MKKITVQYGVDSITKQVESGFTFGDLQESDSFIRASAALLPHAGGMAFRFASL